MWVDFAFSMLNIVRIMFLVGFSAAFASEIAFGVSGELTEIEKKEIQEKKKLLFKETTLELLLEAKENKELPNWAFKVLEQLFKGNALPSLFVRIANIRGWFSHNGKAGNALEE